MLNRREMIQVATSLAHTVKGNMAGEPLLGLTSTLEVLGSFCEDPVTFKLEGSSLSWSFASDRRTEEGRLLSLVPVRCLVTPDCKKKAGHEGPCGEDTP